ncbi:Nudix hydrolase family protein [Pseudoalteromonas luteoviolacea B = ATCC 29581]|nr:Nudix hydrolase family protein [Pseudoalteromonas luteoviolacea B = ATCC 29581]
MDKAIEKSVRVGVAVILIREGKILLGERIGSHGSHTWATPGGHLEFGESVGACAKREVLEETGLEVSDMVELGFTNDVFEAEEKHYITLFVLANSKQGEVQNLEPHKCLSWQWFSLDSLPENLFLSLKNFLASQDVKTRFTV